MDKLTTRIEKMTNGQIVSTAKMIGGGRVSQELNMVRAALFAAYRDRNGDDAADALLDSMGM
jgi:hypothetical protein